MQKILIIGRNGQVSTYLQKVLASDYELIVPDRSILDLSKTESIQDVLSEYTPNIIINPAAYTAVDLAEDESQQAYLVNRDAVAQIAQYCKKTNTPLIHFSTDYVFNGSADKAYTERDKPEPNSVYGESKLAGERAVLESAAPALILRTSWVYSNHGKNFYKTMLMLSQSRSELNVVADQIGAPTYAGSIAKATKQLVDIIIEQGEVLSTQQGIYHFTCAGQTSWHGFAQALFAANKVDEMTVHAIPSTDYPTPAARPAFSVLDNSKLADVFGVQLPDWQDALDQCASQTEDMFDG